MPHYRSSKLLWSLALPALIAAHEGSFAPPAKRDLDKPVISPEFFDEELVPALQDIFPSTEHTIDLWTSNEIPSDCKDMIEEQPVDGVYLTTEEVEVFSVTYSDCDIPWTMCRHPTSNSTKELMADLFGRLPVKLRSFNRHIAATGGDVGAYASDNNVFMAGGVVRQVSVYGHEVGHALDASFYGSSLGISRSSIWLDAYEEDDVVVQSYALASQAENFAQMVNVALYDLNTDGGIATLAPNWEEFGNMLNVLTGNEELADILTYGGTCGDRENDSANVSKDNSSSSTISRTSSSTRIGSSSTTPSSTPTGESSESSGTATPTEIPDAAQTTNLPEPTTSEDAAPVVEGRIIGAFAPAVAMILAAI